MQTISEARQFLRANWEQGVDCPCCGRLVKLYPYTLNANACASLAWINNLGVLDDNGWVHVQKMFSNVYKRNATAMSYILLKHWNFIEAKPGNDDPAKKASGYWRITDKGRSFLRGEISVPRTAMVYKDGARDFKGKPITFKQALGVKFSYSELMNN